MKHIIRSTTGALAAGMIAVGCSTAPPASDVAAAESAIGNAGQAVDHAASDPHVAKYASSELDRASASLEQAKTAWSKKHDLKTTTHLAYIAQQRAATAQQLANERASEEVVRVAAVERDRAAQMAATARPATTPGPEVAQGTAQQGLAGFASGKAKLPPNSARAINDLATTLKDNPDRKVVIEGHTDSVGAPKYNQSLAMKRAEAVRAALLRYKIDPSRILLGAQGEANPVASNDTPAGRRENRRVDVTVGGAGATAGGSQVGSSQGSTATTSSGGGGHKGQ